MPGEWLKRYFVKDDTTCLYTAAPQLKQNVIFRTFNLMDPIHFRLKFDVIFCRNVMIYFDQATRDALVRRFYDALHPTGYLFISHSESLGQTRLFRTAAPAVYQKLPLGTHQ
jgi:chemotaxis protein methyltransferase CheR